MSNNNITENKKQHKEHTVSPTEEPVFGSDLNTRVNSAATIGSLKYPYHVKSLSVEGLESSNSSDLKSNEQSQQSIQQQQHGSGRFLSSMFGSVNQNIQPSFQKSTPSSSVTSSDQKEREWGIFCMENKTDKPIYWGVKGLHIHWKKENKPIILPSKSNPLYEFPPAYYFYNQEKTTSSSSARLKSHKHFFFSSCHSVDLTNEGLSDWNNIIRFKLEPNTFCLGRFPFHTYSDYFILLVGLHDSESTRGSHVNWSTSPNSKPEKEDASKNDSIFSRYFGNTKNSFMNYIPRTQTSVEVMEESDDQPTSEQKKDPTSTDKKTTNKKKLPFHCKAYYIEHFHNKDVILAATVTKSLFLFSDYTTFTLEPITYRFFPNYRPCENASAEQIKLSNNIYFDEIREICIKKGSKKKVNEGSSRNALQFHGLQMYEDEANNTLRESILFFFLFMRKLYERLNILLLLDESEIEQPSDLGDDLVEYLMKFLIGSKTIVTHTDSQKRDVLKWFKSCVKLIGFNNGKDSKDNRYVLSRSDESFSRSFEMYKFNEDSTDTEEFFNTDEEEQNKQTKRPICHVDGVIVLSTVGNKMSKDFKNKLKLLEGFPTLYVLHGLDKCTDIYDAIKRKENAEIEISNLYINSKPYIVQHKTIMTKSQTDSTELILSQFFREVIDVALERAAVHHTKLESSTSINSVMKLFSNSEVKIEIKDLQDSEQKRNVWFFGLDNERETVSAAVNSLYNTKYFAKSKEKKKHSKQTNILVCVRSREQFMNGKDIIPEKKIQSMNQYVLVKRTITDLWSLNATLKRRRSTDNTASTMKKSHSYGALQSLARKERLKHLKPTMRTSVETPHSVNMPINEKSIFDIHAHDSSDNSDTDSPHMLPKAHDDSGALSDDDFSENAIVLVKNDSEEDDQVKLNEKKLIDENKESSSKSRVLLNTSNLEANDSKHTNVQPSTSALDHLTPPIQKGDIVVLCVELSGRILITGENGIFTRFIQQVLNYTDSVVLFVERMDRHEFQQTPILHFSGLGSKKCCCVFGDDQDMTLDQELLQSQDMRNLKCRCYFSSERPDEQKANMDKFWEHVLEYNNTGRSYNHQHHHHHYDESQAVYSPGSASTPASSMTTIHDENIFSIAAKK
ncbi:hypothetical protein C9374_012464 [Naegleria lovaniensis]|uniref:Uncharacterized protein n=1 Tax=Naegleria lovaniensis TaxID=51637 RepID=A0AA88KQD1_NAELO|nr:uncharacterized protein C9374_012464 [Naegleria lovaniensis]KAG2392212.1 hypothetical protein C9374_012464 [Naegleria lovaniensis]